MIRLLVGLAAVSPLQDPGGVDVAKLPPGWTLESEAEATAQELQAVGKKLGAPLSRLTRQRVSAGGFSGMVNILRCPDEASARAAYRFVVGVHGGSEDFVALRKSAVLEIFAGKNVVFGKRLRHLAGAAPGSERVWEARFRVALLDRVDYMQGNAVFNRLLAGAGEEEIREATKTWSVGSTLRLWTGTRPWFRAEYAFSPEPAGATEADGTTAYTFRDPPRRAGLPYVDVVATLRVKDAYEPGGDAPKEDLRRSTPRWPADAQKDLARRLTAKARTPEERVDALLAFVFREVGYGGPVVGSRYGVEQVLRQKHGHCWDKSDVFVTLCRAAGVPARQVAGWVPPLQSGHVWAEVHLEGRGWLPVDPTASWTGTSDDYVPWFSTSDGEMPIVYLSLPVLRRRD